MDAQPHCAEEPELLPRLVCDDISGLSLGASSTQTHTAARTHTDRNAASPVLCRY